MKAGLYSIFIRDWLEALPPNRMHIIHADDYYANSTHVINDVFQFLELGSMPDDAWRSILRRGVANTAARRGDSLPMLPETKRLLDDFYRPFNRDLAQMLNDKRFTWVEQSNRETIKDKSQSQNI